MSAQSPEGRTPEASGSADSMDRLQFSTLPKVAPAVQDGLKWGFCNWHAFNLRAPSGMKVGTEHLCGIWTRVCVSGGIDPWSA